jgi:excisionase family DNA binding protein
MSPQQFGQKTGLAYEQVLNLCKKGELDAIKTEGGHFKIPERELDKFLKNEDYVSKEEYEKVIRENERLRTMINQLKVFITNLN